MWAQETQCSNPSKSWDLSVIWRLVHFGIPLFGSMLLAFTKSKSAQVTTTSSYVSLVVNWTLCDDSVS